MAKKIVMIAPFDVLTGNLSGQQKLKYAENNNPAYEAPNGSQGARNYKTRYVGAQRADGTTYFSVRQKNTAVLNSKTRMAMGLTGVTQACWAAITPADRERVAAIVASVRALDPSNPEYASTAKCWNARCRRMLQYKEQQFVISGPAGNFTFKNPFNLSDANANAIASRVWLKFADLFLFDSTDASVTGAFYFFIDGVRFCCPVSSSQSVLWNELNQSEVTNPNWKATLTGIATSSDPSSSVTYLGQQVYEADTAVDPSDIVEAVKYTTIAPQS